jgi:hypothetical protein
VVTNFGATPTGTVGVSLSGIDAPHFSLANNNCTTALAAQDSCSFQVVFQPTTTGPKLAEVTVTDAADPTDINLIPLSGTALNPASLSISPSAPQSFGNVAVGAFTAAQTFTIRNATGSAHTGTLSIQSPNSDFHVDSDTCSGNTLAGDATCTVTVSYRPTAVEADSGVIQAAATPGGTVSTALSGVGESALRFTAEPAFSPPAVTVGTSVDRTFTVQNATGPGGGSDPPTTGNLVVDLGDAGSQYSITTQTCVGTTLDPGDSCSITVRFTPTGSGPQPGTLTVSASPGNSDTANLNGAGQ